MNNDINFSEYCGKVETGFKPGCRLCPPQAIIPTLSVETVEELKGLANCLVFVSSINTTYYIDDKHRITITWAGPVFEDNYDYETNPLNLRGQIVYDKANSIAIVYDNNGDYYVMALAPSTDFDDLTNRPKYKGELMTGETDIPEVKTDEWDAKADATELADYLPLAGGTMTGDVNNLTAIDFQWDNTYVANPSSAHPYTNRETIAKVIEYYEGNLGSPLPRILSVYKDTEFNNKNIEDVKAVDTSTIYGDDGFTLYINRDGTMPNPDIRHPHGTVKVFSVAKDPISSKSPVDFNGRKLSNIATPTSNSDAANKAYVDSKILEIGETISITTWTALSDSEPFDHQATVTLDTVIGNDTLVELINDNAILFANYGFSILSISGQNVTIACIGEPDTTVTLTFNIKG